MVRAKHRIRTRSSVQLDSGLCSEQNQLRSLSPPKRTNRRIAIYFGSWPYDPNLQFGKSMTERSTCLERWRASSAQGIPILGAGAGTGISAKCAEAAGADLIIIYNSGRYRMAGRGSLAGLMPYGDANAIVVEMAREVLPIVRNTPVLAGVCGTDPFRVMDLFLRDLKQLGFSGVQNFPTVGLIDGLFRESLEETGMGYIQEVEMIARAHELDLITCPYVFNEDEARAMAKAGADLLIAHMGLTTKGTIGARTAITLDQAVDRIQSIQQAAVSIHPEILVLCHGGPIAEPEDVQYVLDRTQGVCGFFGASSIERLPTERAITEQVQTLKKLKLQTERSERSKHV
jgi:predicted TIM-barrel enzyme